MCAGGKVAFFIWIFQTCKNLAFCATLEVQKVFVEWFFPEDQCFSKDFDGL